MITGVTDIQTPVDSIIDIDKFKEEYRCVKGMITGSYKSLKLQDLCLRICMKYADNYPNVAKICRIALVMEVTSVECERSFSTQNRIKSKFR